MKYSRSSLFILILLVLLANALFVSADDEGASDVPVEAEVVATGEVLLGEPVVEKEVEVEAEPEPEPAVEAVPEESETIAEVQDPESTPVIEEAKEEPVVEQEAPAVIEEEPELKMPPAPAFSEETESSKPTVEVSLAFIRDKISVVVDKVKGVTPEDAKKAAAATIGVWGAATGIKWAMQRGGD